MIYIKLKKCFFIYSVMKRLEILKYPNPILNVKCDTIRENTKELQDLIDNMYFTLSTTTGIGLAAPQVGQSLRLFITKYRSILKDVFINPIIFEHSYGKYVETEACLSLPGKSFNVSRYYSIKIRYMNRDFKLIEREYDGFLARLIQHEYDHLKGITIADI